MHHQSSARDSHKTGQPRSNSGFDALVAFASSELSRNQESNEQSENVESQPKKALFEGLMSTCVNASRSGSPPKQTRTVGPKTPPGEPMSISPVDGSTTSGSRSRSPQRRRRHSSSDFSTSSSSRTSSRESRSRSSSWSRSRSGSRSISSRSSEQSHPQERKQATAQPIPPAATKAVVQSIPSAAAKAVVQPIPPAAAKAVTHSQAKPQYGHVTQLYTTPQPRLTTVNLSYTYTSVGPPAAKVTPGNLTYVYNAPGSHQKPGIAAHKSEQDARTNPSAKSKDGGSKIVTIKAPDTDQHVKKFFPPDSMWTTPPLSGTKYRPKGKEWKAYQEKSPSGGGIVCGGPANSPAIQVVNSSSLCGGGVALWNNGQFLSNMHYPFVTHQNPLTLPVKLLNSGQNTTVAMSSQSMSPKRSQGTPTVPRCTPGHPDARPKSAKHEAYKGPTVAPSYTTRAFLDTSLPPPALNLGPHPPPAASCPPFSPINPSSMPPSSSGYKYHAMIPPRPVNQVPQTQTDSPCLERPLFAPPHLSMAYPDIRSKALAPVLSASPSHLGASPSTSNLLHPSTPPASSLLLPGNRMPGSRYPPDLSLPPNFSMASTEAGRMFSPQLPPGNVILSTVEFSTCICIDRSNCIVHSD